MSFSKATVWGDVDELLCKLHKADEEIEKVLPWFYENVKCFDEVKEEAAKDIIRKSEYAPVKKDHVIIRQGEHGDCCYVILNGSVTVYARRIEDADYTMLDEPSARTAVVKNQKDRSKFGVEVSVLKRGDKFGDLCFYKSNGERNATVIADEHLDLLIIEKRVYQKNLAEKFADMKDQLRFMETSALFQGYPYDYRITLLEKMSARRLHYGSGIVRQGDPVKSIFIICRGEALLKVNPSKLSGQFHLQESDGTFTSQRPLTVIQRRRIIKKHGYAAGELLLKQRNVTVATLGPNQIIGDVEFMLNLVTHHVTAVCNSSMLIMEMEAAELHRLTLKRDVGVSDYITASVLSKLSSRANRCADVPQYGQLHDAALKLLKGKEAAQTKTRSEGARKSTLVRVANVVKLGSTLGGLLKGVTAKKAAEEKSSTIPNLLKKMAVTPVEIGGGTKIASKLIESVKKQEGLGESTCQDDVTGTRMTKGKGKTRQDVQGQEKGKKQLTAKEYRVLKKKMQAAGKTIRPLD